MGRGLILGLNQYTHSAAACLLSAEGEVLFLGEKERLTRKKHDGGDVADLVEHALETVGATREDLALVVANNHLFRIDRFHETIAWDTALYSYRESYVSPFNLLPGVKRLEVSHHMAHAWSVMPVVPFDDGLIVVMDGMGSTLQEMQRPGEGYSSEFDLPETDAFQSFPRGLESGNSPAPAFGWREGESVFQFEGLQMQRRFKRWIAEKTPILLHNYGFENMESLGAIYSRVSSHVFGDWNTCGKVMGLAPWASEWDAGGTRKPVLQGPLEDLKVDWERLRKEPAPNGWAEEANRPKYARLAEDLQRDLEDVVLEFLQRQREESGKTKMAFCGGVALNSTLNGRIHREAGFEEVFIPPYPGDQGLAVGCAFYGLHQLAKQSGQDLPAQRKPISPYGGRVPKASDYQDGLQEYGAWLEEAELGEGDLLEVVADAIADNQVVAWFDGPAEFGPRALGNRSIFADPRCGENISRINLAIKKREAFRPFAPTVLNEHAADWFDEVTPSPYMSLTVSVKEDKRALIPAVVHVDGSARIQTLEATAHPKYHALITAFFERTGVPMVLNTSFNIKGEPIVETPREAALSFLQSDLDLLVLGDQLFQKRTFPDPLRGGLIPHAFEGFNAEVVSDAQGESVSTRILARGSTFDVEQLELGLLEACDGATPVQDIITHFAEEWDVEHPALIGGLERLYGMCLISFSEPENE
ncbi:MAG: hypothetical protein O3A95_04075 [Planctomycetota bacterium]|nr:hypothetical protein [Planctomycetota bacterium]MDA1113461.1 hypothetical protein [Planctomycetota bacterium]